MIVAEKKPSGGRKTYTQRKAATPAKAIDWINAYAFFAGLAPGRRTFSAVARHFSVSERRVGQVAKRDGWMDRVLEADEKRRKDLEAKSIRKLVDRDADTIRTIEAMRIRMAQQLADPSFKISVGDYVQALRIERLIEGEPTERVSLVADFEKELELMPLPLLTKLAAALLQGETIEGFAEEVEDGMG